MLNRVKESLELRLAAGEAPSEVTADDSPNGKKPAAGEKNVSGKDGLSKNPRREGGDAAQNTAKESRLRFYDTQSQADAEEAKRAAEEAAAYRQKAAKLEERAKEMQRRVDQWDVLIEQVQRDVLQAEEEIRVGNLKRENAMRSLEQLSNIGGEVDGQRQGRSSER